MEEMKLNDLVFTLYLMLFGVEHTDWSYYRFDDAWWKARLYSRIN